MRLLDDPIFLIVITVLTLDVILLVLYALGKI